MTRRRRPTTTTRAGAPGWAPEPPRADRGHGGSWRSGAGRQSSRRAAGGHRTPGKRGRRWRRCAEVGPPMGSAAGACTRGAAGCPRAGESPRGEPSAAGRCGGSSTGVSTAGLIGCLATHRRGHALPLGGLLAASAACLPSCARRTASRRMRALGANAPMIHEQIDARLGNHRASRARSQRRRTWTPREVPAPQGDAEDRTATLREAGYFPS